MRCQARSDKGQVSSTYMHLWCCCEGFKHAHADTLLARQPHCWSPGVHLGCMATLVLCWGQGATAPCWAAADSQMHSMSSRTHGISWIHATLPEVAGAGPALLCMYCASFPVRPAHSLYDSLCQERCTSLALRHLTAVRHLGAAVSSPEAGHGCMVRADACLSSWAHCRLQVRSADSFQKQPSLSTTKSEPLFGCCVQVSDDARWQANCCGGTQRDNHVSCCSLFSSATGAVSYWEPCGWHPCSCL